MMLVGIDVGTQSLKVVVTDKTMRICGEAAVAYQPVYPLAGWAEQDPNLWLNALQPTIAKALERAGSKAADVSALAVSGQLDGCIGVNSHGEPIGPAIIWMDRRAAESMAGIDAAAVAKRAGLVPDASHMAAKIQWNLKHNENARKAAAWHQPTSFMVEALTGSRVIDHCLASTTMLYNLSSQSWDDALLWSFGIDGNTLPVISDTAETAGSLSAKGAALTGLPKGLPVAVGTGDDFATLLGCGISSPGTLAISIGTGEIIGALSDKLVIDPDQLVETHAFPTGHFHLGNPGWLSGGAVRWFLSTFSVHDDTEFSALAAQAPPGSDGLLFIPALTGAMAPVWVANARGTFHGLTTAHSKAHLARALLEGTAFAMRDVIDRLTALGVQTGSIRIMGGGSKSHVWMKIRADVMGRAVDVAETSDASALGAAIIAAVVAGIYPDLRSATAALKISRHTIAPDRGKYDLYNEAYGQYRKLFAALLPLYN